MMKKNKEILKQAGTMSLIYLILCLGGAYESYYRGADLRFTVRTAGCVLLFMCVGMLISMIKKEYDPRRYLGYISLIISLGLMLQVLAQGNILVEKRVKLCVAGYGAALVFGVLVGLYATRKLIVKNKVIKEMLHIGCTILGFLLIFMCSIGKIFTGRRGAILIEMTGGQKNSGRGLWYIIMGLTWLFTFTGFLLITCAVAEPDHFKKKN